MEKLLTTSDAAKILGVSADTVRRWERIGKLPAERTSGGIRLFKREEVEKLEAYRRAKFQRLAQIKV